jgi:hypothetical protein
MRPVYSYYLLSLFTLFLLTTADNAGARQDAPPHSWSLLTKSLDEVEIYPLPAVDRVDQLGKARAQLKGADPMPFAVPNDVSITPDNAGTWTELADGSRIWQLRFHAEGATDFNFGFVQYRLPAGAELHVYSEDKSYYQGPYTSRDNKPHDQLWTPVVPTAAAVVELFVPPDADTKVLLELGRVSTGFTDLFGRYGGPGFALAKQGACNNDVICDVGDPWRNEIRSVAGYGGEGFLFCTGTLIMDVPGSFRPFFLTADHCNVSAASAPTIVVYWNFESPSCGALSGGSLDQNQTGATFHADRVDVDMTLLELDAEPDPAFDVYYAGWDATGTVPLGSVGIHHPNGDEKAISFNDDPLTTIASCILANSTPNTHWRVDNWEDGTTEPGSSGSGLWDPVSHQLVGFLSGGAAACDNTQGFDCYGKFSIAWDGPTAVQRLRDWLDPAATGTLVVDGSDPGTPPASPDLIFEDQFEN